VWGHRISADHDAQDVTQIPFFSTFQAGLSHGFPLMKYCPVGEMPGRQCLQKQGARGSARPIHATHVAVFRAVGFVDST